jgi:hypothetical protein
MICGAAALGMTTLSNMKAFGQGMLPSFQEVFLRCLLKGYGPVMFLVSREVRSEKRET